MTAVGAQQQQQQQPAWLCACSAAVAGGVLAAAVAAWGPGCALAWLEAEGVLCAGAAWRAGPRVRAWQCSVLARVGLTLLRLVGAHTAPFAWAAALVVQTALLLAQCVAVPSAVPFGPCALCGVAACGAYLAAAYGPLRAHGLPHAVLRALGGDRAAWAGFACRCVLDTLVATLLVCRVAGRAARQRAECERAMAVSRQSARRSRHHPSPPS